PVHPRLASAEVENRSPPGFAVQLEEAARAEARLPQQMAHVVRRPADGAEPRTAPLEEVGARQRRQNRKSRAAKIVLLDERPQPLEIGLVPVRIDDEVAGDAVAQLSRDSDRVEG